MAMYDVDDVADTLDLHLPDPDAVTEDYEATDLEDAVDGYRVENWRGLDVAVLGFPQEVHPVQGGANPAHYAGFADDAYRAAVTCSPRPMDFDQAFRFDDYDVVIGTDPDRFHATDTSYVELDDRIQPSRALGSILQDRDDIRDSAAETVARFILHDGDQPVGDDLLTRATATLHGDEPVPEDEYDRIQQLSHHFVLRPRRSNSGAISG